MLFIFYSRNTARTFSVQSNRRIQRNSVSPSTKFTITTKLRKSLPQLNRNFLKQILMSIFTRRIKPTNLMDNILIILKLLHKRLLQTLTHTYVSCLFLVFVTKIIFIRSESLGHFLQTIFLLSSQNFAEKAKVFPFNQGYLAIHYI